jgi:two-component system sensor histidine kinase KdpD
MSMKREHDGVEPSGFAPALRRAAIPAVRGCLIVAVVTAAAFRLHLNAAAVACIFMILVVVNCLDGGPWAAAAVSVTAVGCLDFFFTQPLFSFNVNDPVDGIALVAFLTSSLLVSRLAGMARQEARTARRDRGHLERLYELAQRVIALDPSRLDEPILLDAVRSVFDLKAAALFDAATAQLYVSGDAAGEVGDRTRQAYIMGQDSDESERHRAFRQLRPGGKAVGAIGLDGLEDERIMGGPVAALAAAGLERGRIVRAASRAAAEAESEALRAAVLDALAHEFKTPLATILTAAGGLREAGPLQPEQTELAEIVETEAERLSDLSFHLLRLAKLDREEIRARSEPTNIVEMVTTVVGRYARRSPDRQILFRHQGAPEETWLDLELYPLALSQLLDNACRYSPPRSTIEVSLEVRCGSVAVTVLNGGDALSAAERSRIFERFYRGEAGRRTSSGTGLGLYVARKIAHAHGGSLDLDEAQSEEGGVAFRLAIPLERGSQDGAATISQDPNR